MKNSRLYNREEKYAIQIERALVYYKSLSVPFTIRSISELTGLSEEIVLEILDKKYEGNSYKNPSTRKLHLEDG
ncbi:hypothetical protein QTG56_23905 (plasmid) [Rossellomorea sp. AcN35-11]|nr:hypothetical protein [Rossellomorea aquimaris]WJV32407.1 hypothetical protein QTG56_23905 [Rossellomorea sp. AcN35-11]